MGEQKVAVWKGNTHRMCIVLFTTIEHALTNFEKIIGKLVVSNQAFGETVFEKVCWSIFDMLTEIENNSSSVPWSHRNDESFSSTKKRTNNIEPFSQ